MDERTARHLLGADPTPWLLASDEPYARWVTLTRVLGRPDDDPEVDAARRAVLLDEGVISLVGDLPSWGEADFPGHHSPQFLPNRLNLLADMGVRGGDFERIEQLLDGMLQHQGPKDRFQSFGRHPKRPKPEWGSLLCDTNVITDVLLRFGRADDERVTRALERIEADLAITPQGPAWQCIPEHRSLFRGPGRKADVCPQVTLEGLRAFSHVPEMERPVGILAAARTPLEVWRRRSEERPYMFGHGYQFKSVKWPDFWYDVLWVLETIGRYPSLYSGPDAIEEDRRAVAELAACLIAYNFDAFGRVTPARTYRGFEAFSFGGKSEPSPFATARALAALVPFAGLSDEISAVDVEALPSSKGGSGTARPPRRGEPAPCPMPSGSRTYPRERAAWRALGRHHLVGGFEPASVESVVGDIVGLHAASPTTPFLSLAARLPGFERADLEDALYERRSLARFRCMRGALFVVRRGTIPVVRGATTAQVMRYARRFAEYRGITEELYGRLAPLVLDAVTEEPLTTSQLRERLDPDADLGALVSLMCAEGLLLRDRPAGGWTDRRATYVPLAKALPGVRLTSVSTDDADLELVRGYVRAFGPVTAEDAAWWTGLGPHRTRRALDRFEDELIEVSLAEDDRVHVIHSADIDELGWTGATASPLVNLLPPLDPLVMGYADKGRFMDDAARPYVFDRAGNVTSIVLVDGCVAGVWDFLAGPEPTVLVHLFEAAPSLVTAAVVRVAESLGRLRADADAAVRFVDRMTPLSEHGSGWIAKPLH